MNEEQLEEWLNATDDEREAAHAGWKVDQGEGKEVAIGIAALLKEECVYNVNEVDVRTDKGRWVIKAFVDSSDYVNLKNRYNISFLGFHVSFGDAGNIAG